VDGPDRCGSRCLSTNVTVPGIISDVQRGITLQPRNDSVYAFDADGVNSGPLWQDVFVNPGKGITPIPCKDTGSDPHCPFDSVIGITRNSGRRSNTGTMYVVAATQREWKVFSGGLHALDITSGAEKLEVRWLLKLP